jgi:hypothetical protein
MLCSHVRELGSTHDLLLSWISEIIGSHGGRAAAYWWGATGVAGVALLLPSLNGEHTWFIGGASATMGRNRWPETRYSWKVGS